MLGTLFLPVVVCMSISTPSLKAQLSNQVLNLKTSHTLYQFYLWIGLGFWCGRDFPDREIIPASFQIRQADGREEARGVHPGYMLKWRVTQPDQAPPHPTDQGICIQ